MRNYKMQMRMGIHSGSCVGGVVGSKMPHFSVFGDTVNIAGGASDAKYFPLTLNIFVQHCSTDGVNIGAHEDPDLAHNHGAAGGAGRFQLRCSRSDGGASYW